MSFFSRRASKNGRSDADFPPRPVCRHRARRTPRWFLSYRSCHSGGEELPFNPFDLTKTVRQGLSAVRLPHDPHRTRRLRDIEHAACSPAKRFRHWPFAVQELLGRAFATRRAGNRIGTTFTAAGHHPRYRAELHFDCQMAFTTRHRAVYATTAAVVRWPRKWKVAIAGTAASGPSAYTLQAEDDDFTSRHSGAKVWLCERMRWWKRWPAPCWGVRNPCLIVLRLWTSVARSLPAH